MRRAPLAAGCLAVLAAGTAVAADIVAARYDAPTTRYAHGVLGDAVEWGALILTLSDGRALRLMLPETRVFEDTAPRLADVDMDGDNEVITVESSLTRGARLAIHDETGRLAATPYIGQAHRWLAPVGAGDLDGDGHVELAYVDRPHLAKVLRIWRFADGALAPVAAAPGFANHKIGWDVIAGGLRGCGGVPELIVADGGWTRVMAVRLRDGRTEARALGPYAGPGSLDAAMTCR